MSFTTRFLTGQTITSLSEALTACDALHAMGPTQVVITSFHVPAASFQLPASVTVAAAAADGQDPPEELLVISSERIGSGAATTYQRYLYTVPRLPGYFAGTGDLTAALLLVFSQRTHSLLRATQITYVLTHAA